MKERIDSEIGLVRVKKTRKIALKFTAKLN